MKFVWTNHALERQKQWQIILGITRDEVEAVVENPEQIVKGDLDIFVAQSKRGNGILRVPFINIKDGKKIITLYWTSKIEKYWKD